jgi:hypothetical protein
MLKIITFIFSAPLKHTSMLTENDKVKNEGKKDQQVQKTRNLALDDFEVY